jgi:hypothetical protein
VLRTISNYGPTGSFISRRSQRDVRTADARPRPHRATCRHAFASFFIGAWVFNRQSPRFAGVDVTATGTSNVLEVEHVTKTFRIHREKTNSIKQLVAGRGRNRYDEFTALKDVSFDVARARSSASSARTARASRRC